MNNWWKRGGSDENNEEVMKRMKKWWKWWKKWRWWKDEDEKGSDEIIVLLKCLYHHWAYYGKRMNSSRYGIDPNESY